MILDLKFEQMTPNSFKIRAKGYYVGAAIRGINEWFGSLENEAERLLLRGKSLETLEIIKREELCNNTLTSGSRKKANPTQWKQKFAILWKRPRRNIRSLKA